MKDAYYQIRGWDKTSGVPTPETLVSLGLGDLVADLWGD
jgi:aldehyde:ferredoxin oxidoreductase